MDVDKPHQLEMMRADLDKQVKSALRKSSVKKQPVAKKKVATKKVVSKKSAVKAKKK